MNALCDHQVSCYACTYDRAHVRDYARCHFYDHGRGHDRVCAFESLVLFDQ